MEEEVDGQEEGQDDKREKMVNKERKVERTTTHNDHMKKKKDGMSADPNMSQCMCV